MVTPFAIVLVYWGGRVHITLMYVISRLVSSAASLNAVSKREVSLLSFEPPGRQESPDQKTQLEKKAFSTCNVYL